MKPPHHRGEPSMPSHLFLAAMTLAVLALSGLAPSAPAVAQVMPERDACRPVTSAKSRDGNCVPCSTGRISTRPGFIDLVQKLRANPRVFDDVDRRIDGASSDPD